MAHGATPLVLACARSTVQAGLEGCMEPARSRSITFRRAPGIVPAALGIIVGLGGWTKSGMGTAAHSAADRDRASPDRDTNTWLAAAPEADMSGTRKGRE